MNQDYRDLFVSALLVGNRPENRLLLHAVFKKQGWRLHEAADRKRALQCLERQPVQVVVADADAAAWSWKRVLEDLQRMTNPPQLVVTSRLADDFLWSEVLNRGGYDVLPEPFQAEEVERVISSARRHFDGVVNGYRFRAAAS
ncbi:MAG TPA: response regulator [Bryobacteraceae bacterium]